MSEAVEGHRRHAWNAPDHPVPLDADLARCERGAVIVAKHQSVSGRLSKTEAHSEFELLTPVFIEVKHRARWQCDFPPPMLCLGRLESKPCLRLL